MWHFNVTQSGPLRVTRFCATNRVPLIQGSMRDSDPSPTHPHTFSLGASWVNLNQFTNNRGLSRSEKWVEEKGVTFGTTLVKFQPLINPRRKHFKFKKTPENSPCNCAVRTSEGGEWRWSHCSSCKYFHQQHFIWTSNHCCCNTGYCFCNIQYTSSTHHHPSSS